MHKTRMYMLYLKTSLDQNLPLPLEQFKVKGSVVSSHHRGMTCLLGPSPSTGSERSGVPQCVRDSGHVGSPCGLLCRQRFSGWRKEMQEAQVRPGQKACSSLAHQVMIWARQSQTLGHLQGASCSVAHKRDFVEARGWEQAGGAQQSAPPPATCCAPPVSGHLP